MMVLKLVSYWLSIDIFVIVMVIVVLKHFLEGSVEKLGSFDDKSGLGVYRK